MTWLEPAGTSSYHHWYSSWSFTFPHSRDQLGFFRTSLSITTHPVLITNKYRLCKIYKCCFRTTMWPSGWSKVEDGGSSQNRLRWEITPEPEGLLVKALPVPHPRLQPPLEDLASQQNTTHIPHKADPQVHQNLDNQYPVSVHKAGPNMLKHTFSIEKASTRALGGTSPPSPGTLTCFKLRTEPGTFCLWTLSSEL